MFDIYSLDNDTMVTISGEAVLKENLFSFSNKWINMVNPTDKEVEYIANMTRVSDATIKAALDEEERPRIEIENNVLLVLVDAPIIEAENNYFTYSTIPVGIILGRDFIITVCLKSNAVILDLIGGRIKNFSITNRTRFLFLLLNNNATKYLQYLKQIDKSSQRIQSELHKSMKNKELIQLLDLEKSIVYFSTSLRGNEVIILRLGKLEMLNISAEDRELLEDLTIENQQAIEVSNIHREILSGTMDAFASVISNNLNIVMKVLTAITIVLAIPTLIASFYGMNVGGIPNQGNLGFFIVISFSLMIAVVAAFFLFKKKLM